MFDHDEFDKSFRRAQRFGLATGVFMLAASVAVPVFLGWVIIQVMRHYGII